MGRGHIPGPALSAARLHPAKVDAREDDEGEERARNVRRGRLGAVLQQVSRRRRDGEEAGDGEEAAKKGGKSEMDGGGGQMKVRWQKKV